VGGGMAGASLAAELSGRRSVILVEAEDELGRHATGRSAAMFTETHGASEIRALTRASREFLRRPPANFTEAPLLSPRGCLFIADEARIGRLDELAADADIATRTRRLTGREVTKCVPILRQGWSIAALLDETWFDIDVSALHQAYLRRARCAGVKVVTGTAGGVVEWRDRLWNARSRVGDFAAPVLVNAAGAWADQLACRAGVETRGLQPLRRAAITLPAPSGEDPGAWPAVIDVDEEFYFKPRAGQILLSPANEDPADPCDAAPVELDVAIAIDRFERATTCTVSRVTHRWAGLRTFAHDRTPVVGFDGEAEGFFWLAGQGGYGIQTAPALARLAAALVLGETIPEDISAEGIHSAALSPNRPALAAKREQPV
jgi:D-arginine dehydrogenase